MSDPADQATTAPPPAGLVLIYTTLPDTEAAEAFGAALIEAGAVACANLLNGMTALYRWKGELERASEVAVLLKTTRERLESALALAAKHHPYEVPALIVLEPERVNAAYLAWAREQTASNGA